MEHINRLTFTFLSLRAEKEEEQSSKNNSCWKNTQNALFSQNQYFEAQIPNWTVGMEALCDFLGRCEKMSFQCRWGINRAMKGFHPSPAWWTNKFTGVTYRSMMTGTQKLPLVPSAAAFLNSPHASQLFTSYIGDWNLFEKRTLWFQEFMILALAPLFTMEC